MSPYISQYCFLDNSKLTESKLQIAYRFLVFFIFLVWKVEENKLHQAAIKGASTKIMDLSEQKLPFVKCDHVLIFETRL